MMKKSPESKDREPHRVGCYNRPPNPRQYRSRNLLRRNPDMCIDLVKVEPPEVIGVLECTTAGPREEIIAQIKVESEYRWGLEAEDSEDFNPYKDDVLQDPVESTFEWVTVKQEVLEEESSEPPFLQIKQEELDLDDIAPNCTPELPSNALSQTEYIKVEPPEPPEAIKQEELDVTETEDQSTDQDSFPAPVVDDPPIETISVDDDEKEGDDLTNEIDLVDESEQTEQSQEEIATICVDDSDDESPSIEQETVQKSTPVHNYEHTCIPRRLYPPYFVKRFVKRTTYRGYSIRTGRLLNGASNKFSHIYACDYCDQLCATHALMKQHLTTHNLKSNPKQPNLFITTECQICFRRHLDDPAQVWEHFDQVHYDEMYRAAEGQKFAVRIECRICRRWFPQIECLECGEWYSRSYGITWHNRIHRREARSGGLEKGEGES